MRLNLHMTHKYAFRFVNLLNGSQCLSDIKQRGPERFNFNVSNRRVLFLESAIEVLGTSLQYKVVVRDRVRSGILLAVFIPSEALDDAILVPNAVVYSPFSIKTVVVFELLNDQLVILYKHALVSAQKAFDPQLLI